MDTKEIETKFFAFSTINSASLMGIAGSASLLIDNLMSNGFTFTMVNANACLTIAIGVFVIYRRTFTKNQQLFIFRK